MKKLLLLFLLLPTLCIADAGLSGSVATQETAAGSYTDITFWCSWEGTWSTPTYTMSGDDYSAGDTTGTITSDCDVTEASKKIGSWGLFTDSSGDYMEFVPSGGDIIDLNDSRIGFYFYVVTSWVATIQIFYSEYDANNYVYLQSATDGELFLRVRSSGSFDVNATTSGATLVADTWYYVEIILDQAGNGATLKINGSNTSIVSDAYDAMGNAAVILRFGNNAGAGSDTYSDNHAISNDVTRDLNALKDLATSPR